MIMGYVTHGANFDTDVPLVPESCQSGGLKFLFNLAEKPTGEYPMWVIEDAEIGSVITTYSFSVTISLRDADNNALLTGTFSSSGNIEIGFGPAGTVYNFSSATFNMTRPAGGDPDIVAGPNQGTMYGFTYMWGQTNPGSGIPFSGNPGGITLAFHTVREFVPVGARVTVDSFVYSCPMLEPEFWNVSCQTAYRPVASFTADVPEGTETADVDGSASSDFDGTIAEWQWNFGDGSTANTGTGLTTHDYTVDGEQTITLIVKDNDGGLSDPATQIVTIEGGRIATRISPSGSLYIARQSGETFVGPDIAILKRRGLDESFEPVLRGTLEDSRMPWLLLDSGHNLFLMVQSREDSTWRLYSTDTELRTAPTALAEVWPANYRGACMAFTGDEQFISIARRQVDSIYYLDFKSSKDGTTWTAATEIGEVSKRFNPVIWQRTEMDSTEFFVSDCDTKIYTSDKYGRAPWTAATTTIFTDTESATFRNAHLSGLHDGGLLAVADCRSENEAEAGIWARRATLGADNTFTWKDAVRVIDTLSPNAARVCNAWQMLPIKDTRFLIANAATLLKISGDYSATWDDQI